MRSLIVIVFIVLLTSCGVDQSSPEAVAAEYVEAVYTANTKRFKMLVEKKHLESTEDYRLFVTGKSTARSTTREFRGGLDTIDAIKTSITKDRATVRVRVVFKKGKQKRLSIRMHSVDGDWFVDPMSWSSW